MSLIQRFSILCFVALALIGSLLGWTISTSMERHMLERAIQETSNIVQQNTVKHFKASDLLSPKTGSEFEHFSEEVEHLSLGPQTFQVKFWGIDKVLLWTSEQDEIGKRFESNGILSKAISGETATKIITSNKLHDKYQRPVEKNVTVLELYVPVTFENKGKPNVVVEVYYDLTKLYNTITDHKNILWTRIFIGFSLLYLVLFGIVYGASKRIVKQNLELEEMLFQTVTTMISALDAKSSWTKGHSQRTEEYAAMIADAMGIDGTEKKKLMLAGILHDIGKIGTYDYLLEKAERLTDEEFEIIKKHPEQGVKILSGVKKLDHTLSIIKHHHERYDGRGYPDGLKGEEIPVLSRILQIADSYDAMTADRPYRNALSKQEALDELFKNRGTQFDPEIVDKFLEALQEERSVAKEPKAILEVEYSS